ncbi:MAG: phosphatidate cytidylyltransferase [Candidatus Aminicenantes bacterium]|nr:phosphatidate cytidylyltransferase [Candidatus Aminicenantes bacterium]
MKEFTTRNLTAVILILLAYIWIRFTSELVFSIVLFFIISMAAIEWVRLCRPEMHHFAVSGTAALLVAASFTFGKPELADTISLLVFLFGVYFLLRIRRVEQLATFIRDFAVHTGLVFYLFIPLYYLLRLKQLGPNYLFFLMAVIAIGDSFAYFVGSLWARYGKRIPIYPVASPKKSLQGLIAAVLFAAASAIPVLAIFPLPVARSTAVWSAAILGLLSQLSDPVESLFKRAAGRKDSGSVLPGHGGVLDRVDSYIFCAPALYALARFVWV